MRRVYMSFMLRNGWYCLFLEEDLKTPLPKRPALTSHDKILELARRGGAGLNLETEQALSHAFEIGRGGVWLELTDEQYRKLKWPHSPERSHEHNWGWPRNSRPHRQGKER